MINREDMSMSIPTLILLSFSHLGTNDQNDQNWKVTGISQTEHLSLKIVIVFSLQVDFSQTHQNLMFSKRNTFQTLLLVLYASYSTAFLCIKRMIRQARTSTWTETNIYIFPMDKIRRFNLHRSLQTIFFEDELHSSLAVFH